MNKLFKTVIIVLMLLISSGCVSDNNDEIIKQEDKYLTLGDMEKLHNKFINDDFRFIKELENGMYSPFSVIDKDNNYYYMTFWDNFDDVIILMVLQIIHMI